MGSGLRREIENMLLLVPGEWHLESHKANSHDFFYTIGGVQDELRWEYMVSGRGCTKNEALRNLLENWRAGRTKQPFFQSPAASKEELEMKLTLLDFDCRKPKR